MIAALSHLVARWAQVYGDQKALSAGVAFVHVAGILLGGGLAIATDRDSLRLAPTSGDLPRELTRLHTVHRWVLAGLGVTIVSGLLMMLADLPTFLPSVLFWTKIGLLALLLGNGALRQRAERTLLGGNLTPWRTFRLTSALSLVLWFSILLAGSFLPTLS